MFLMVYFKSGECARKARATPPVSFFSKDMETPNPLGRATLPADRQAGLSAK